MDQPNTSVIRATVARMLRPEPVLLTVVVFLLVAVPWGYWAPATQFGAWTGFGEYTRPKAENQEYQRSKTLWDWMGLLIVPGVLALGAYWLNQSRESLSRETEDKRRAEERKREERRYREGRKLEHDRLREETLQRYLDCMAELMLGKGLRPSKPGGEPSGPNDVVRNIARARTLTVLRRLDGSRKGILLRFLHESDLIIKGSTVIRLHEADFRRAVLAQADLPEADLCGADLRRADLRRAVLEKANLSAAKLNLAKLFEAKLFGADLFGVPLPR